MVDAEEVLVGYPDEESTAVQSWHFPSKVGGKPAWLVPDRLPSIEELRCPKCTTPMTFLLQVYGTQDFESDDGTLREDVFHRTLFVFACVPCKNEFSVYRCQLPRKNSYYDFDPPEPKKLSEKGQLAEQMIASRCCEVCGLPAEEFEEPKLYEIEEGAAELEQDVPKAPKLHDRCYKAAEYGWIKATFREFVLSAEREDLEEPASPEELVHEKELLQKYLEEQKKPPQEQAILDASEVEAFQDIHRESSCSVISDSQFQAFLKRIAYSPGHLIRYAWCGKPLWLHSKGVLLETDMRSGCGSIPNCENCGSRRVFEMQIQPTLIYEIEADFAFGIIAIFTCSKSCRPKQLWDNSTSSLYLKEHLYLQREL